VADDAQSGQSTTPNQMSCAEEIMATAELEKGEQVMC
jgi:hypothetical protein